MSVKSYHLISSEDSFQSCFYNIYFTSIHLFVVKEGYRVASEIGNP